MNRIGVLAALSLVACADDEPPKAECDGDRYTPRVRTRTLAELPDLAATVGLGGSPQPDDGVAKRTVVIWLQFGEAFNNRGRVPIRDPGDDTSYCPELDPDVTAIVAGVSAEIAVDGGWICPGAGGPCCGTPRLEIALPTALQPASAEVVLSSGAYSRTFALGDALATRTTGDTFGLGEADITRTADTITFTPPQRMGAGRLVVGLSGSFATDTLVSQLAYLDVTFVP